MRSNYKLITQLDRPLPLTGVNPRSIMSSAKWHKIKRKTYQKFNFHCECCGIKKENAKIHQWLECHEQYVCDYVTGICKLFDYQPLCFCCHHFIHRRRLEMQCKFGKVSEEIYKTVLLHGLKIVTENKLTLQIPPTNQARWEDWRLHFNGYAYKPLFDSKNQMVAYQEWLATIEKGGNDELLAEFKRIWNKERDL